MNKDQALLKSFNLAGQELKNRVLMAPMTRSRADNPEKVPTAELQGEY
jgi:N-ethylmaleimide reductase